MYEVFQIETTQPVESIDLTERVREIVEQFGAVNGLCHVMVMHSTAAIVVNETHDPNIGVDDNAAAHIKASILGPSELMLVQGGKLVLGTWQGIMLLEFDGPRKRSVSVQILSAGA